MTNYQGTATITKIEESYIGSGLSFLSHRTAWRIDYSGGHLDGRRGICRTRKEARETAERLRYDWRPQTTDHYHASGRGVMKHTHTDATPRHTHQNAAGHDNGPAASTREGAIEARREQLAS